MEIIKKVIKFVVLGVICIILILVSYIYLNLTIVRYNCKKQALSRIERFLSDYRQDNENAVKKYNVDLAIPLNTYKQYRCKFESIKDTGDGDPIYRVIYTVTLIEDKSVEEYKVEQSKYGVWMDMDWTKK